jgi:hypothetical protein
MKILGSIALGAVLIASIAYAQAPRKTFPLLPSPATLAQLRGAGLEVVQVVGGPEFALFLKHPQSGLMYICVLTDTQLIELKMYAAKECKMIGQ